MRVLRRPPRSTESRSTTYVPPSASSWAEAPEFYCDENVVTRSVKKFLKGLGYIVHTPAEIFGTRADSLAQLDETWLAKVAQTGWVVLNRDAKIMRNSDELAAYRKSGVHMFYLPGEATRDQLLELVSINLAEVCVKSMSRPPKLWILTLSDGVVEHPTNRAAKKR